MSSKLKINDVVLTKNNEVYKVLNYYDHLEIYILLTIKININIDQWNDFYFTKVKGSIVEVDALTFEKSIKSNLGSGKLAETLYG